MNEVNQTEVGYSLRSLLEGITAFPAEWTDEDLSIRVSGVSTDSRCINPGDLFIACVGMQADGRDYIENAIERGAVAVLAEAGNEKVIAVHHRNALHSVPILKIPTLANYVGPIAARFYGDPSMHLMAVGFTGTNGKTSCTQYMAQALAALNKKCGIVGTLGTGFLGNLEVTGLTTPDAVMLQRQLALLRGEGGTSCCY